MSKATDDLVDRFAASLKEKLNAAEQKYGFANDWLKDDWQGELIVKLLNHVQKGDPRDVAAYCAFAWHHGWSIAQRVAPMGNNRISMDRMQAGNPCGADARRLRRAAGGVVKSCVGAR